MLNFSDLSQTQKSAFDMCMDFFVNSNRKAFVLSGVAGTGKTEIILQVCQMLLNIRSSEVVITAPTGRAVSNLWQKMIVRDEAALPTMLTLHKLLYIPRLMPDGQIEGFDKRPKQELQNQFQYIIVDEASMVGEEMFNDLMELEIPILFVGDSEQLPPVSEKSFNVMQHSDLHLTEIHRQAERNPIIALSRIIRETGEINISTLPETICALPKHDVTKTFLQHNPFDVILTGTNRERLKMNRLARIAGGYFNVIPEVGECIVCLKNFFNNSDFICNGSLFVVRGRQIHDDTKDEIFDDFHLKERYGNTNPFWVKINRKCWDETLPPAKQCTQLGGIFGFGNTISVWKAQGSEFDNILFYDEDVSYFVDRRRFRYTAVTRAKEKLTIAY